jgi:hypothetical protein
MTAPAVDRHPANSETNAEGARWYIHPTSGERFISVTTVLSNIAMYGLPAWAANLSANAAFERLPMLNRASRVQVCNLTKTVNACGRCRDCVTFWLADRHNQVRDAAADRGVKLHDLAEQDALFGEGAHVDADVAPYWEQYQRWRDAYQPTFTASEMTVISRKWGYAGTLDSILTIAEMPKTLAHLSGLPCCADLKTSNAVYLKNGWQVVAYANADAVLLPDGTELPMPEIRGGLILHIFRDKKTSQMRTQMREVHLTDANFQYFIHLLRVTEGLNAGLNTVLSRPVTLKETN